MDVNFTGSLALAIVVLVFLIATGAFSVVHQQTVVIVERLGRFSRLLQPGLNIIIPFLDRRVYTVHLSVNEIKASVDVKTKDNVFVTLPLSLMVRVIAQHAQDSYYQLANPKEQISAMVLNVLRSTVAGMELAHVFEDREAIVAATKSSLTDTLAGYGVEIVSVIVDQPQVSAEVQKAFDNVIASQRKREAAENEAQAARIKLVGQAKAESESQILRAEGLAKARQVMADSLQSAASVGHGDPLTQAQVMDFLMETNRLDTIRDAATHGRMVVMDVRNAGVPLTLSAEDAPAR